MSLRHDIPSSIAVFLVALPLCLGIALASGVPLMGGLLAGIIGGIVVGALSGSHTSVSGPAAGLVAIVLAQVAALTEPGMTEVEGYQRFLVAVFIGGALQIVLSVLKAGFIAYYFPSSVIRGLLAAIGLILILKQIPHAIGYDQVAEGDFTFFQEDGYNTFSEIGHMFVGLSHAAVVISVVSLVILIGWERSSWLKRSPVPGALIAVVIGTAINEVLLRVAPDFALGQSHRVSLGGSEAEGSLGWFIFPDWTAFAVPKVYLAGVTIAIVASLETLLNLEAVDKLDRQKRVSPANRELLAQGVGNMCAGMVGGLPITSVIVRGSANVYSGAKSKASTILHGVWLVGTIALIPGVLEMIPLSSLAAILIFTGYKLANPAIFRDMFSRGWNQFLPFLFTVVAIVMTDLLLGIIIGLFIGVFFILRSMERAPFLRVKAQPTYREVTRLKLGQHVTFLNRSRMLKTLDRFEPGSHVILDATETEYIDADVLELIREFRDIKAPARKIDLSMVGFEHRYDLKDQLSYIDTATPEIQLELTPVQTLELLWEGNVRYRQGELTDRDWSHQRRQTLKSQHPHAALLGCIDSRVPSELVFDLGIGDLFVARVAGNVVNDDILGSLEYAGEVARVNLIVVLGHTNCGAVGAACAGTQLGHVTGLLAKIEPCVESVAAEHPQWDRSSHEFCDAVVRCNVERTMDLVVEQSQIIRRLVAEDELQIVGGVYDLETGEVEFFGEFVDQHPELEFLHSANPAPTPGV